MSFQSFLSFLSFRNRRLVSFYPRIPPLPDTYVQVTLSVLTLKQTNKENGNVMTTNTQAQPVKNLPHMPGSTGTLSSAVEKKITKRKR